MDIEYIWMSGEKLLSILVANMELIISSVHSSKRTGGDWAKGVDGGIVILSAASLTSLENRKIWFIIQMREGTITVYY